MRKVTIEEANEKLKTYGIKVEMVDGKLVKKDIETKAGDKKE